MIYCVLVCLTPENANSIGNSVVTAEFLYIHVPLQSRYPDPSDFLQQLEEDPGFCNPHCVENLKAVLGISSTVRPSLLREIQL